MVGVTDPLTPVHLICDFDLLQKDGKQWLYADCQSNTCRGMVWCNHRTSWLQHNQDAEPLHRALTENVYFDTDGVYLLMPVMPTSKVFGRVWVKPHETGASDPKQFWSLSDQMEPTWELGLFTKAEGLGVVRKVLLNYYEVYVNQSAECMAARHDVRAQREWERHQGNPPLKLAEAISIHDTRLCITCADRASRGADAANSPDLLPEA